MNSHPGAPRPLKRFSIQPTLLPLAAAVALGLTLALPGAAFAQAAAETAPPAGKVVVTSVAFSGVSETRTRLVSERASATLPGRALDVAALDEIVNDLTATLRATGLLVARVVITSGDYQHFMRSGELKLSVFEGRVGAIEVQNSSRVDTARLERVINAALCPNGVGDTCVLTAVRLERATQLVQDIPGAQLQSGLSSDGVAVGQTRAIFTITPGTPVLAGSLGTDNYGTSATGIERFGMVASANNLLGMGDLVDLMLYTTARHQNTGRLGVSAPLGYAGWRAEGSLAHSTIPVPLAGSSAKADIATAGLAYPLVRGLQQNWSAGVDAVGVRSVVDTLDVQVSDKKLVSMRLRLHGDSGDLPRLLGDSYSSQNLALLSGRVSDGKSLGNPSNALGSYQKLSFDYFRKQNLVADGSLYAVASVRGQWVSSNLDPFEKLAVGGNGGVRGYGNNEGSFDQGVVASTELRYLIKTEKAGNFSPGIIVDYANGWLNHSTYANWQLQNGYANTQLSNHRAVAGYGLALDWVHPQGLLLSVSWARRFPGSAAPLSQTDSSASHLWFSLTKTF